MQGHAKHRVAAFIGCQAKRCWQIDSRPFERRTDPQLAVGIVQGQLQLIRQHPGHRDRLIELEPVGQFFNPDLTACHHAGTQLARLALGKDLRLDRLVECATADGFAAQALGAVEAEVALELGQFKFWITDFQAGLVGVEIHHDFRLFAMLQRDVEINAALERALALPAGKG